MVFKPDLFKGEAPERVFAEGDADLERAVADAIAVTGGLQADAISVTRISDRIVLSGTVSTREEVDRAEAAAQEAAQGVPIENRLTVDGPAMPV